jgi:hypothetical protein
MRENLRRFSINNGKKAIEDSLEKLATHFHWDIIT